MKIVTAVIAVALLAAACSSGTNGESSDGGTTSDSSTVFPSSLAVASPFDVVSSESASAALTTSSTKSPSTGYAPRYAWATGEIDQVLNGTTPSDCRFDPNLFMTRETNADCFGPRVRYEAHPNASSPSDPGYNGELPSGDVGIWTSVSPSEGHACAAAELNARLQGVRDKSLASLMGLASLICTANLNSLALPNNSTLNLTSEMNALGVPDVTFTSASISHSDASGQDEWSYDLDFEYTPGSDTHHIVVAMIHVPSGTPAEYQGRLSYRVNEDMTGGNCPAGETTNGSLLYQSGGLDDMGLEVRSAQFCGDDSDGMTDGLVDPSKKYDASSNPTGWGNNFNLFTANFDPGDMDGDFAYSWQAGPLDQYTRVFNIHAEEDASSGVPAGKAFYGYGPDIDGTDGATDGFICDWTTPNHTKTVRSSAQYQAVSFDTSTGKFQSDDENIAYAVTTSCEYAGTGSFRYDSNLDGVVDTNAVTPVANDLLGLTDANGDGLFDEIEGSGFTLPTPPPGV